MRPIDRKVSRRNTKSCAKVIYPLPQAFRTSRFYSIRNWKLDW